MEKKDNKMKKDKEAKVQKRSAADVSLEQKNLLDSARKAAENVRETKQKMALQIWGVDDSLFEKVNVHGASTSVPKLPQRGFPLEEV